MKIPLFDKSIQVRTAKAVEPNYSIAPRLAETQSKAEKATTDGVFKIIEEGIGLGAEYLKEKEKIKIENNDNNYQLAEAEIPNAIRDLKTEGADLGYNEQQTYDVLIRPYLDGFLDEWGKDDKNIVTKDIQDKFNITNSEYTESNLLELDNIANKENQTTTLKISQGHANVGEFEIADEKIDRIVGLSPDEKATKKQDIRKTAFSLNLLNAKSLDEIDEINKTAKKELDTQNYINFQGQVATAKSNLFNTKSKPFVDEVSNQLKDGNFSMLDKREDGTYINAEMQFLDDVSKRTLEALAETQRKQFDSMQSRRDLQLNSEAKGRLYLDDLLTEFFDPNTAPDKLDDIHNDIMEELKSEKLDADGNATGKFAYPQFFVTDIIESIAFKIDKENGLDMHKLPPESQEAGYIYGIQEFNRVFNGAFKELDSNTYLQQFNESHNNFYEEINDRIKAIRGSKIFKEAEKGTQAAILRNGIDAFIKEKFKDVDRELQLFRVARSLDIPVNVEGVTDEEAVEQTLKTEFESIEDKASEILRNKKVLSADERRKAQNKKKQGQND
mgnify:CR=1 FL=1